MVKMITTDLGPEMNDFVGLTVAAATVKAEEQGLTCRVVLIDGILVDGLHAGYAEGRVNFETEHKVPWNPDPSLWMVTRAFLG